MVSRNGKRLLYLINPRFKYRHYGAQSELSQLVGKRRLTIPVQLPLVAALTPDHYTIKIFDDETDPLVFDPKPDLVGITTLSVTSGRVFEISKKYRALGVPVVLGGPYTTFGEEECLEHSDHIIVGEAEGTWQRFLSDFEKGVASSVYRSEGFIDFKTSPTPRWDLVDVDDMMSVSVETSRGCPFKCEFCLVNKLFGHKMRFRDIDDVVEEIESVSNKRIFFVADNFAINKDYARELISRLKPLNISFLCQTSVGIAKDPDLLDEMAEAGCVAILVGFESLDKSILENIQKKHNRIEEYENAIRQIHARGINVFASFIVGFEDDTLDSFDDIYEFINSNNLIYNMINVLSVSPGTAIYKKMDEQGRINLVDPSYRNGIFPCADYNRISQTEMFDRYFETLRKIFDTNFVSKHAIELFSTGKFTVGGNCRVPFTDKFMTSLKLLRRYILNGDSTKRRMFWRLMTMVKEKKLSANSLVILLLSLESFLMYLDNMEPLLPKIREEIQKIDRGPWLEQVENTQSEYREIEPGLSVDHGRVIAGQ